MAPETSESAVKRRRTGVPGYFLEAECVLKDLERVCTDPPGSTRGVVVKGIPVYNCSELDPANLELRHELARVLSEGAGVFVLAKAFTDFSAVDAASKVFQDIIEEERTKSAKGDHFAEPGANDRIWNAHEKLCLKAPQVFATYYSNAWIAAASEAWLGPGYQVTAQVNVVRPGGKCQAPHRDYHLGFMNAEEAELFPAHVHTHLSPMLSLQGGLAHCDVPIVSGPTKLLPHSQKYPQGYVAWRRPDFKEYFEKHYVQLPLNKGDLLFFNPALFHAAGSNESESIHRMVNLLQVNSALGRAMETVDRKRMSLKLYPACRADRTLSPDARLRAIRACADDYAFPTNLDKDPPEPGRMSPQTMAGLFARCLSEDVSEEEFGRRLEARQQCRDS